MLRCAINAHNNHRHHKNPNNPNSIISKGTIDPAQSQYARKTEFSRFIFYCGKLSSKNSFFLLNTRLESLCTFASSPQGSLSSLIYNVVTSIPVESRPPLFSQRTDSQNVFPYDSHKSKAWLSDI